jgi:hypothetical protein
MTLEENLRLSRHSRNSTKNIGCQVCKVLPRTTTGNGATMKIPEKTVGFVSGARLCHEHKGSPIMNNLICEKRMAG